MIRVKTAFVFVTLTLIPTARAEKWSRAYVRALPDSAFAVIETGPHGAKIRRLPHHDRSGTLDIPHLRAALSLCHRTHWINPVDESIAMAHLRQHLQELRARS